MKHYITIVVVAVVQSLAHAQEIPLVESGMVTTLSSKFFSENRQVLLDAMQKQMDTLKIEDSCSDSEWGLVKLTLCLSNQRIADFNAKISPSDFKINENFTYNIYDLDLKYAFDFELDSVPWWFVD